MVKHMNVSKRHVFHYRMEFHISRAARDRYQFDPGLFASNGNLIIADFRAARLFAQRINDVREVKNHPDQAVRAGDINAMGLIDEILHLAVEEYRRTKRPALFRDGFEWTASAVGGDALERTLMQFCHEFPPRDVYLRHISVQGYFAGESVRPEGQVVPNSELMLEEMLMLWIANQNPALQKYNELFNDNSLSKNTSYPDVLNALYQFFSAQPAFGDENQNLIDFLLAPARKYPYSLADQLKFIRKNWTNWISIDLLRLLSSLDVIREEQKPVFGLGGEPQSQVYSFTGEEYSAEPERFSRDLDWMPNLVLLAKNAYVWLDQLARKYGRAIHRLDQVPEEELASLASCGFSGLWLIGLWERSEASRQIKQLRGNPDAVASAYSLHCYDIAADLGGDPAYHVLKDNAWKYGIRLASDMVPNHMGIDSQWVIDHPDWFIQRSSPPFPSYTFNGPDFSGDGRVGIYIEDHYFDNSDAAVVFKRLDRWTGEERFIYHGNDGTSMPWNDTAQLNYLLPEVREAVIQTILHVARMFPIIRFDAAMTLAKRHYQRLWFPEPGSGGDIPSRAEEGMSKAKFNELFPEEFWRMVVDRVAVEAPDTLLLAEAFWLMEGYFVRTLGMHRVYNSAFMNMLRDEKNQEYRLVIKNTLEFDPQILKRYVNFMNNPDERTAVDQFGKGDKYFGICTMLAAMPGLPMFGHGQIEGYTEKYGMEFRYPKWHEQPDTDLVERHRNQIFPLLRKRYLFADVQNFRLFDFFSTQGAVHEDVFAFTNQNGNQRALVVYHNRYAETAGWIKMSAAFPVIRDPNEGKMLVQMSLAEALGLNSEEGQYLVFRDLTSGLEYIRPVFEIIDKGFFLSLTAYRCHVFEKFEQMHDDPDQTLARLCSELHGEGVSDIAESRRELIYGKVLFAFQELVNPGMLNWLFQNRLGGDLYDEQVFEKASDEADAKIFAILESAREILNSEAALSEIQIEIHRSLVAWMRFMSIRKSLPDPLSPAANAAIEYITRGTQSQEFPLDDIHIWTVLIAGLIVSQLGRADGAKDYRSRSRTMLDDWLLGKRINSVLTEMGMSISEGERALDLIRVLISAHGWYKPEYNPQDMAEKLIRQWVMDPAARDWLRVHTFEDVFWFNKESFEDLAWWTCIFEFMIVNSKDELDPDELEQAMAACHQCIEHLDELKSSSGYQLDNLIRSNSVDR